LGTKRGAKGGGGLKSSAIMIEEREKKRSTDEEVEEIGRFGAGRKQKSLYRILKNWLVVWNQEKAWRRFFLTCPKEGRREGWGDVVQLGY